MSKEVVKPGSIQINFDEKGNVKCIFTGEVPPRRMVMLPYHLRRAYADFLRSKRTPAKPEAPKAPAAPTKPEASKPLSLAEQLAARKAASTVAPVATSPTNLASP